MAGQEACLKVAATLPLSQQRKGRKHGEEAGVGNLVREEGGAGQEGLVARIGPNRKLGGAGVTHRLTG